MVVLASKERLVRLDVPKKAVPVGTVAGVQLVAALKLPEPGLDSQVAFCACAKTGAAINAEEASSAARTERGRPHRQARTNGSVLPPWFGGSPTQTWPPPASGRRRDVPNSLLLSAAMRMHDVDPSRRVLRRRAIPLPP